MERTIALVDDHHLVRTGLAAVLNKLGGYRVVLEAAHGREMKERLLEHAKAGKPLPALAIIDLNMPVMDGYATLAWLRTHEPAMLPLALTFDATDEAMVRAVHAGARGFILKNARPEQLKHALDSLATQGYYYSDDLHEALSSKAARASAEEVRVRELISPREMEFLLHVCAEEELTYDEIATRMGVNRRSVDNYRISLFQKFHIKSKTGLVLFAMRYGLIK